jgi:hypothetical protein
MGDELRRRVKAAPTISKGIAISSEALEKSWSLGHQCTIHASTRIPHQAVVEFLIHIEYETTNEHKEVVCVYI